MLCFASHACAFYSQFNFSYKVANKHSKPFFFLLALRRSANHKQKKPFFFLLKFKTKKKGFY